MSGAAAATLHGAAAPAVPPSALPPVPERAPSGAQRLALPGGRWHLQHGPIDIVLQAEGEPAAVVAAHQAAWQAFDGVLAALVAELPVLRQPVLAGPHNPLQGEVARRMWTACAPMAAHGFITPMAAVAGAVAQQLIHHYQRPGIQRAWVNNGGDIALHLASGTQAAVGWFADLARLDDALLARTSAGQALPLEGRFTVHAAQPVRGVATSGWRGRSFSLGIADSVTVLAASAAQADAAATVVANAVNLDHPAIQRRPAQDLKDDSDLGDHLVTVAVGPLPGAAVQQALAQGRRVALALQRQGLLWAAALRCQGLTAVVAPAAATQSAPQLVQ